MTVMQVIIYSSASSLTFSGLLLYVIKKIANRGTDYYFKKKLEKYRDDLRKIDTYEDYIINKRIFEFNQFSRQKHKLYPRLFKKIVMASSSLNGLYGFGSVPSFDEYNSKDVYEFLKRRRVTNGIIEHYTKEWDSNKDDKKTELQKYMHELDYFDARQYTIRARNYFYLNELYMTDEICEKVKSILGTMGEIVSFYETTIIDDYHNAELSKEYQDNVNKMNSALEQIKAIMKKEIKIGDSYLLGNGDK